MPKEKLYSPAEVASWTGLHVWQVRRAVKRLDIPVWREGDGRGGGLWMREADVLLLLPYAARRVFYAPSRHHIP